MNSISFIDGRIEQSEQKSAFIYENKCIVLFCFSIHPKWDLPKRKIAKETLKSGWYVRYADNCCSKKQQRKYKFGPFLTREEAANIATFLFYSKFLYRKFNFV